MYTNVNLAAPVGVLLFLGTGFLLFVAALPLVYSVIAKRCWRVVRKSTSVKSIATWLIPLSTYARQKPSLLHPLLLELACAGLRLPVANWAAWHVFFGRGSFPDVDLHLAPQTAV
jgi:hypothetical protein